MRCTLDGKHVAIFSQSDGNMLHMQGTLMREVLSRKLQNVEGL